MIKKDEINIPSPFDEILEFINEVRLDCVVPLDKHCCRLYFTIHLWLLMLPLQLYVIIKEKILLQVPVGSTRESFFIMSLILFLVIFTNTHYLLHINTEDAFQLLAIGVILSPKNTMTYLRLILRHWRIMYFGMSIIISVFYISQYLYPINYETMVAWGGLLIMVFQRSPLYIRRQKFFDESANKIMKAQESSVQAIIQNRLVIQKQMREKRGIKIIYLQNVNTEASVMRQLDVINCHMKNFKILTNPMLQYFTIIRYVITWLLTNIIIKLLLTNYNF